MDPLPSTSAQVLPHCPAWCNDDVATDDGVIHVSASAPVTLERHDTRPADIGTPLIRIDISSEPISVVDALTLAATIQAFAAAALTESRP